MPTILGESQWSLTVDEEGHREYSIAWIIEADNIYQGPNAILNTPGLPRIGSLWDIRLGEPLPFPAEFDPYAVCSPSMKVSPITPVGASSAGPTRFWKVEQTFSTRPIERDMSVGVTIPFAEPPKIRGNFTKTTEEAYFVRDELGELKPIRTSSWEMLSGKEIEFDKSLPSVTIEVVRPSFDLMFYCSKVDTVNDKVLWGLPPRTVKLSNVSFVKKYYGVSTPVWVVTMDFDVNIIEFDGQLQSGWDKKIYDRGTTHLAPGGNPNDPDPKNWTSSIMAADNERKPIFLKDGLPWTGVGTPGIIEIKYYRESNFLELGVPATL